MRRAVCTLVPALFLAACQEKVDTSTPSGASEQAAFESGWLYGRIQHYEQEVVRSYDLLLVLQSWRDDTRQARQAKKIAVLRLNCALSSLHDYQPLLPRGYSVDNCVDDIQLRSFRELARRIRQERLAEGWTSDSPEDERKIAKILDHLCRYGMPSRPEAQPTEGTDAAGSL